MGKQDGVVLDHWLVASEQAYRALGSHWRTEAGPDSLLDWRMRNGLLEAVPTQKIRERILALAGQGETSVSVIVETADTDLLEELEPLAETASIQLLEWHASPLAVVLAMNGPDRSLLSALEGHADIRSGRPSPIPERADYEAALARWEMECRSGSPEEFAEAYPRAGQAVAWSVLIGTVERLPLSANDNDWIPIPRLAAATRPDEDQGFVLDDPEHEPALWDITLAPIDGGPRALLRFRVVAPSPAAFVGKRVLVRSGGLEIDLGTVDETGRASTVIRHRMKLSDIFVAIIEE